MNHRKVRKLSQFNFLNYRDEFKHRQIYEKKKKSNIAMEIFIPL